MIRTLIGGAAVAGALTFGAAGMAGAASAATPSPASTTHTVNCVKAEKLAARINARETKAATWVPKAQAREAKATAAGHTKLATWIARRITRVQKLEARGNTVLAKISAKCGSATSSAA